MGKKRLSCRAISGYFRTPIKWNKLVTAQYTGFALYGYEIDGCPIFFLILIKDWVSIISRQLLLADAIYMHVIVQDLTLDILWAVLVQVRLMEPPPSARSAEPVVKL